MYNQALLLWCPTQQKLCNLMHNKLHPVCCTIRRITQGNGFCVVCKKNYQRL